MFQNAKTIVPESEQFNECNINLKPQLLSSMTVTQKKILCGMLLWNFVVAHLTIGQ